MDESHQMFRVKDDKIGGDSCIKIERLPLILLIRRSLSKSGREAVIV